MRAMDRQTQWLPPGSASEPIPPPRPQPAEPPSRLRRAFGPLFVVGALIVKFGKLALLFLTKAKFLATSLSMLVSIGAYSLIWGWKFAVGFVALLFVHEMGHYIQLRREGVKPSGMLFIPFLGAVVGARSLGGSALAEARVGLAGPILGSLACFALVPFAISTGDDFWRALIFTGLFLNLLNLMPVVPLDGGRAMAAMAPGMWFVGFGGIVLLFFIAPNPILILIILLGGMETWRRWKHRREGEEGNAAYYDVKPVHRLLVGLVYVGLIAVLAVGMDLSFVDRASEF
jgi:Zn-dependent protease